MSKRKKHDNETDETVALAQHGHDNAEVNADETAAADESSALVVASAGAESENEQADDDQPALEGEIVGQTNATEEETPIAQWQATVERWVEHATMMLDRFNQRLAPVSPDDEHSPNTMARGPILFGAWLMIFIFGFLGLWSAVAPLASAAIAPGRVILSGSKKTIQHLEGGLVEEIYVREGQAVKANQPLIRLNETATKARLDLFKKQFLATKTAEARLIAERDNHEAMKLPEVVLKAKDDPEIAEIITSQQQLMKSRRDSINGRVDILNQKVAQYDEEITGLEAQITSATRQISLLQEEIDAVAKLLRQGNAQKPRLLALQRQQADLKGKRGEYKAMISRAKQAIGEAKLEIINTRNEFANKVASEMKETVEKLADLQERLKASVDIMDRIIITAPLAGVITDLQAHTIGGVIKPGDKIMEIVPIDELLVEAKVSPQDIDVVVPGLKAQVRLSAYKARSVPPVEATVVHVSPDRFDDRYTGESYYLARIEVAEKELEDAGNLELTPGMPAEALIITGERTMLAYMLDPITDSFRRAFRED